MISNIKQAVVQSFTPPAWRKEKLEPSTRIEFIDLAKGICILLVLLLHTDGKVFNFPNFDAVRMPLYFVLSGLFFKKSDPKTFHIKKINNMIIPFIFWIIIFDIVRFAYRGFSFDFASFQYLMNPTSRVISCNLAIWFLMCLFITNIMFYAITYLKNTLSICLCISFLLVLDWGLFYYHIPLPFWIDSAISALPFFYLGYMIKQKSWLQKDLSKSSIIISSLICISISYLLYLIFDKPHIEFRENIFMGIPILAYINGLFFVIGLLLLCKFVVWLPLISYIGRYSIVLLCIHQPLIGIITWVSEQFFNYTLGAFETAYLIVLLCWILTPIIITTLPQFVAQTSFIKVPLKNSEISASINN